MGGLRRFALRLLNAVRPNRAESELAREIASHVALLEEDYRRRGMTPEEATRAAVLALGGKTQTQELHRDARSFVWVDDARRDACYAMRMLRRNPIMAATVGASLAIGIGANTAIFTVANALLFRPPVGIAEPDRLADIGVGRGDGGLNPGSYPLYRDLQSRAQTLDGIFAREMFPHAMSLRVGGDTSGAERVYAHVVSTNYFSVLGVKAHAGRVFEDADDALGGGAPTVLDYRYWTRRFDGDPRIVGRTILLNDHPFTVVGVAPEGFQGAGVTAADVWVPLTRGADRDLSNRASGWLIMGGRLKPDAAPAQASAEVDAIGRDLAREYPEQETSQRLRLLPSSVVPGNRAAVGLFILLLSAIVSAVLLVACANLSGILLARAAARQREIAVRLAMGADRSRLIRQLLMETAVLFAIGAAAGLGLAMAMTRLIAGWLPSLPFPIVVALPLDIRVIAFTAGVALVAALMSGLVPALRASRSDVVGALKNETHGAGRARVRRAFVVAQVALSILLVVVAGLFVRALQRAGSVNPGFDARRVELTSLDLSQANYTEATGPRFARTLLDRIRATRGVESATLALTLPGGFETQRRGVSVPGVVPPSGQPFVGVDWNAVAPGYFSTLRIPLLAGRDFTIDDRAGGELVAIVGEGIARQFWPGEDAVGKHLVQRVARRGKVISTQTLRVVGVSHDVRASSLIDGLARSLVYVPIEQQYLPTITIVTRSTSDRRVVDDVRTAVRAMDPNLPIVATQTLDDSLALGLVPQRIAAALSGSLGLVGLLLAAIGIYGVTAYAVACRTREIGVRVALGAGPSDVVRMVLREGMSLATLGAIAGLILAAGASRALAVFLLGTPPFDVPTFSVAAALFLVVGIVACYVPVRRATRIHAMEALRYE